MYIRPGCCSQGACSPVEKIIIIQTESSKRNKECKDTLLSFTMSFQIEENQGKVCEEGNMCAQL